MVIGTLAETCQYDFLREDFDFERDYVPDEDDMQNIIKQLFQLMGKADTAPINWIDKILIRIKHFAHKLEWADPPKDGRLAKLFHKLKEVVGKAIRKLTTLAMRAAGTYKRAAGATTRKVRDMVDDSLKNVDLSNL